MNTVEQQVDEFLTEGYQAHNRARQDHLAALGLDLNSQTVLELGAGIGDHTKFWLDRGCSVTCVEGRPENLSRIKARFPNVCAVLQDLDSVDWRFPAYDIVYAYGILYHLTDPIGALYRWSYSTRNLLLLETVVSRDGHSRIKEEDDGSPTAAIARYGVWPTRTSILFELCQLFPCVYTPREPPDHIEFPTDWDNLPATGLIRTVVIASRIRLNNDNLLEVELS